MSLSPHELSVGLFVRGLTNLKAELVKAQQHATTNGIPEAALLGASLARKGTTAPAPADVHAYSLAGQVHWAAEGARLALAHLTGAPRAPATNVATSFAELHEGLDSAIAYLERISPADLAASLDRIITIERRQGSMRSSGRRFLVAYAIPHFFYHVSSAYGILRNQDVPLTMGDFLGDWSSDR